VNFHRVKRRLYQVDAFADRVFEGNPAAVCPLDVWPEDGLLQEGEIDFGA
jgi:predicted PhzF superfamily epimerase YddE/YHI9